MTDERKKHGWALWATVVALSPVVYILPIGPVQWLNIHGMLPDVLVGMFALYLRPYRWLMLHAPDWYCRAISVYLGLWIA